MTRPTAIASLFLLATALLFSHCQRKPLSVEAQKAIRLHWAESIYQSLSPQERVGQLFMIALPGFGDTPANNQKIRQIQPGGIILFEQNIKSFGQTSKWLYRLQQKQQARTGLPLWITADQENGRVQRFHQRMTEFPCAMAVGRAQRPKITQTMASVIGLELGAYGLNMNLAPVADINNNPRNPVIGDRSFGTTPQGVKRQVSSYIQGFQDMALAAVAKHFPGHGDTHVDSHKALPVIRKDLKKIRAGELVPFKAAIRKKVFGIMSAHILFPSLDPQRPATLSPAILTDLLRRRLGYSGLILTDDLVMNAISRHYPDITYQNHRVSAPAYAVLAGANIILHSAPPKKLIRIRQELLSQSKQKMIQPEIIRRRIIRSISFRLKLYLNQDPKSSYFSLYQRAQRLHRRSQEIQSKVFLYGFRTHNISARLQKRLQSHNALKAKNNSTTHQKKQKDNQNQASTDGPAPVLVQGHSPSSYWQTRLGQMARRYGLGAGPGGVSDRPKRIKQGKGSPAGATRLHLHLVGHGQVSAWARRFTPAKGMDRLDVLVIRTPFAYKNPQKARTRAKAYSRIPADLVLTTAGYDRNQIQVLWRSLSQRPWKSLARLSQTRP